MPIEFTRDRRTPNPLEWSVDYDINSLGYRVVAFRNIQGYTEIYECVGHKYVPGDIVNPTFTFTHREEMQSLMNELWRLGVRPNDYTITNEHFNSVKEHLGDMKALVERAYKLEFPKPRGE